MGSGVKAGGNRPKIVFFGNERLATGLGTTAPLLRSLVDEGYEVAAVVVAQGGTNHGSRKTRQLEVMEVAGEHGIPVLMPEKLSAISEQLQGFNAEVGVLAAYGKLVPQSTIDIFPAGIVNIHPSLLPLHRGSMPIEAAMVNGDSETGVSLMQLVKAMDAGPVYAQEKIPLNGNETKQELLNTLSALGVSMLKVALPQILAGALEPTPQDDYHATYDGRISKEDGELNDEDWQQPAERAVRKVRAFAGWPRTRVNIGDKEVIITAAHSEAGTGVPGTLVITPKTLGIQCTGSKLIIDSLIPAGKKEMSAQAFLAGYTPYAI